MTGTEEWLVESMMALVGLGLIALVYDFVAQRRRAHGEDSAAQAAWISSQYRTALRTGLFVLVAYFEVCCVWLLLSNRLLNSHSGTRRLPFSLQTGLFLAVTAILLVWLGTWVTKHLHLIKNQATLQDNEQRLRLALQSANQALFDLDLRTGQAKISPEYATMLGYDPANFHTTPERWLERLHPDDREPARKTFESCLKSRGEVYRGESRQRTASGEWKWILSLGKVVEYDRQGRPVRMLGTHTDITQFKLAEARIEQQAEALRQLSAHLLESQDIERRRIARELHDTTAQHLAALSMNLSVIEKLVGDRSAKVTRLLVDSEALVDRATQEIRTTTYLLHPPLLEAAGLAGALQDYAEGFARRSGLKIEVVVSADFERLPREVELVFFRVIQESLANVRRHSQSLTARISLEKIGGQIKLEVRDAGVGIPADKLARLKSLTGELGVGIAGMHERLDQLGGNLEIESDSGGTVVRATWSPDLVMGRPE